LVEEDALADLEVEEQLREDELQDDVAGADQSKTSAQTQAPADAADASKPT